MNNQREISPRMELIAVTALLLAGFALRLLLLDSLPMGLNQDEASAGYDAFALLSRGTDRCGNTLPVLLESWGSGQNALLSYLALPFIRILGLSELSIRLPMAIVNCLALVIFWLLARRTRGPFFGLCALMLLALCPWHIMASRWALESNLLPPFLLAGLYCTQRAKKKIRWLAGAALCFGLSLYAYGTAYFFLPFFLIFALIWLRRELKPAALIGTIIIFVVLALPISLCQLRNALDLPELTLCGITLPALTESRQLATSVLGGGGVNAAFENFKANLKILVSQSDGLIWNSLGIKYGGICYIFGLPLAIVGVIECLFSMRRCPDEAPMMAALLCCLPGLFLIDGNINRLNMLWLPLVYFSALGLYRLCLLMRDYYLIALSALVLFFGYFAISYHTQLSGVGNPSYFPGLGRCIEYVDAQEPESAFISYYVNQPYIFALFYTEESPEVFENTVDYVNPDGAFRWVRSYGYWRFGDASEAAGEYLILHVSQLEGREVLACWGEYAVCRGTALY